LVREELAAQLVIVSNVLGPVLARERSTPDSTVSGAGVSTVAAAPASNPSRPALAASTATPY